MTRDSSASSLIVGGAASSPRAPLPTLPPLSLYIHIPWCVRKCPYCDFNSHTASPVLPEQEYVDALLADLDQDLHAVYGREISTIFFGGGTPSLFSAEALGRLLADLSMLHEPRLRRVIVTLNLPDPGLQVSMRQRTWPFDLQWIDNARPLGFGANHNRAFEHDQRQGPSVLFAVLNPDLRLRANPFAALTTALQADAGAGLAYPVQRDAAGRLQDHERRLPTPARLLARYLLRRKHEVDTS